MNINYLLNSNVDTGDFKPLDPIVENAQIVGIGEGAHFTRQFNESRSALIQYLIEDHCFKFIALECSSIQAARLNDWLYADANNQSTDLSDYAGPLTIALYGTVLKQLKSYLISKQAAPEYQITFLGVDIPNTLTPHRELENLDSIIQKVDPHCKEWMDELLRILSQVQGESAVMSSSAWGKLEVSEQDRAFSILTRIKLRLKGLEPEIQSDQPVDWVKEAIIIIKCVEYTLESLRAMSHLFSGKALEGETSVREAFISQSLVHEVGGKPNRKIIFLAHNNHIQKKPVSFAGELSGVPAGQHLAGKLGNAYRSIALTHLGNLVPEMDFPSQDSPVGFDVKPVPAASIKEDSIEYKMKGNHQGSETSLLALFDDEYLAGDSGLIMSIRSQSATALTDVRKAFDAVICTPKASLDESVGSILGKNGSQMNG